MVDNFPGYQSRHLATLFALYRVTARFEGLPDAEMVIDLTDGNVGYDLPIWLITRPVGHSIGVLYPDFTFFSWPEAICPPERSHAHTYLLGEYEKLRAQMAKEGATWTKIQKCILVGLMLF